MKQSKFNIDASHLTYIVKWNHQQKTGDHYPVCFRFSPLSQWKRYETLDYAQTRGDDMLIMNIIDSLLSFFYYLWLKAGGYFPQIISIFCVKGWTGVVPTSGVFCFTLVLTRSLQQKASSTTFVHTQRYNQRKTKVSRKGLKVRKVTV